MEQIMLFDRAHVLLKDDRKDLRIRENIQVPWQIKYRQRHGLAKIRNISASGMLIETNRAFDLKDECIFSFDAEQSADTYIPQIGRLVWHKRKKFSRNKYLCGIKFVEAEEKILQRMRQRVASGVRRYVRDYRIMTITGLVLCAVFMGLMIYIIAFSAMIYNDVSRANEVALGSSNQQVMLSQNAINLYRGNEVKLAEASEKLVIASRLIQEDKTALDLYAQELDATKALLAQTETMLIEANDQNVVMNNQLQEFQSLGTAPDQRSAQLPATAGVALGDGSLDSIDEARTLLTEYKTQINNVKGEIKRLVQEERATRDATIEFLESQRFQIGNNGFIIRDGANVQVDESQFQSLTIGNLPALGDIPAAREVEIDIQFMN